MQRTIFGDYATTHSAIFLDKCPLGAHLNPKVLRATLNVMAFTITVPKNLFLKLLFMLLVMVLAPLALFFSLVRLPFAKHRINKLSEILRNDWMPREKYIYIGSSSDNTQISDFLKDDIFGKYGKYIIWDAWDDSQNVWTSSEPDDTHRVTTFWQDIGGDFDGDAMVIIATYGPDDFAISTDHNFHQFWVQDIDRLGIEKTEKEIQAIVSHAINTWKSK